MTERPILFSGPMVRAILDGRKTQTRRVVKPQPRWVEADNAYHAGGGFRGTEGWRYEGGSRKAPMDFTWASDEAPSLDATACPYGQPGDRLWVRETWGCKAADRPGVPDGRKPQPGDSIQYAANDADAWQWRNGELPWRPSIHMPRWASRLTLEVTDVHVERVQDISDSDVAAEGLPLTGVRDSHGNTVHGPRNQFVSLWQRLHHSKRDNDWRVNPWVWVIEFTPLPTTNRSNR